MHAYLWDRYYGISLAKYKHTDVVNSVAFNPKDNEMLVTTSDDFTIKVRLFYAHPIVADALQYRFPLVIIDLINNEIPMYI